jgi:hypothetical protein
MLSNQDILESKFRDLDLRVMTLQVIKFFSFLVFLVYTLFLVTN